MKSTLPSSPPHPLRSVRPSQVLTRITAACSWTPRLSSGISVTVAKGVDTLVSRCPRCTSRLSTETGNSGQLSDPSQPRLLPLLLRGKLSSVSLQPPVPPRCGKDRNRELYASGSRPLCCWVPDCAVRFHPPGDPRPAPRSPPPAALTPQTTRTHGPSAARVFSCRHQRLFLGACSNHCLFKIFLCVGACEILEGAWLSSFT